MFGPSDDLVEFRFVYAFVYAFCPVYHLSAWSLNLYLSDCLTFWSLLTCLRFNKHPNYNYIVFFKYPIALITASVLASNFLNCAPNFYYFPVLTLFVLCAFVYRFAYSVFVHIISYDLEVWKSPNKATYLYCTPCDT